MAKNVEPESNFKEYQKSPKRGMFLLINKVTIFFKNVNVIKDKDRQWKCSRLKETEEA